MGRRQALLIASTRYEDRRIPALSAPKADVEALGDVLRAPELGGFDEVRTLIDRSEAEVRRAVAGLFQGRLRDDLVLLYFSGHGALDHQRRLYLMLHDSRPDLLHGTALAAGFISQAMEDSAAARQVLILDCCHSGAFGAGSKSVVGEPVDTAAQLGGLRRKDVTLVPVSSPPEGEPAEGSAGRVVITASDATQYAFEGEPGAGLGPSLFTRFMVEGLRTGAADVKGVGEVTVQSLYDYVYAQVKARQPGQEPCLLGQQRGALVLARTAAARLEQTELPPKVRMLLDDTDRNVALAGVQRLRALLQGEDRGLVHAARRELAQVATTHENVQVRAAAQGVLESVGVALSTDTPLATGERRGPEQRSAFYEPHGSFGPTGASEALPAVTSNEPYRPQRRGGIGRTPLYTGAGVVLAAAMIVGALWQTTRTQRQPAGRGAALHSATPPDPAIVEQPAPPTLVGAPATAGAAASADLTPGGGGASHASGTQANGTASVVSLAARCTGGDGPACHAAAGAYAEGDGVPRDAKRATELLLRGCQLGAAVACNDLGLAYEQGDGIPQDLTQAAEQYRKACIGDSAAACYNIGRLHRAQAWSGASGHRALELFDRACQLGDGDGCRIAGWSLDAGDGARRDIPRAVALYEKGCAADDQTCCNNLGLLLQKGEDGIARDYRRARALFSKSCEGSDGLAVACSNLGYLMIEGLGGERDVEGGVRRLRRGCNGGRGSKVACARLRRMNRSLTDD